MTNSYWKLISSDVLAYGDVGSTIRAKIFGKMVGLSKNKLDFYLSDLFHDALWLKENITGPMQFDWIVRTSGTFIGEQTLHIKMEDWPGAVKYRFELMDSDQKWVLNIYECTEFVNEGNDPVTTTGNPENIVPELVNPVQATIDEVFGSASWVQEDLDPETFPTLRDETTLENTPERNIKMRNSAMDSVLQMLDEKLQYANAVVDELIDAKDNLEEALDMAKNNVDEIQNLIDSLDLNIEDIRFEADIRFISSY